MKPLKGNYVLMLMAVCSCLLSEGSICPAITNVVVIPSTINIGLSYVEIRCEHDGNLNFDSFYTPSGATLTSTVNGKYEIFSYDSYSHMFILYIEMTDIGSYQCNFHYTHNGHFQCNREIVLSLDVSFCTPNLTTYHYYLGDMVTLNCCVKNQVRQYWKKEGSTTAMTAGGNVQLNGTSLLLLLVTQEDEGDYECIATGTGPNILLASLKVYKQLSITLEPQQKVLDMFETARLTCIASAYPLPTIVWTRDGVVLETGTGVIQKQEEMLNSTTVRSVLLFHNVTNKVTGTYKCTGVANATRSKISSLQFFGTPSAPEEVTLAIINGININVTWKPPKDNGNLPLLQYQVLWFVKSSHGSSGDNGEHRVKGSMTNYIITNLLPVTQYTVVLFAVNERGKGVGSADRNITTLHQNTALNITVGFEKTSYTMHDTSSPTEVCVHVIISSGRPAEYNISIKTKNNSSFVQLFQPLFLIHFSVNILSQRECFFSSEIVLNQSSICEQFPECKDQYLELRLMKYNDMDPILLDLDTTLVLVQPPISCSCHVPTPLNIVVKVTAIAAAVVLCIILAICATVFIRICYLCKKKQAFRQNMRQENEKENHYTEDTAVSDAGVNESSTTNCREKSILSEQLKSELCDKRMIYSKSQLHLSNVVGQGESGLVYKAYLDTAVMRELVAVKTGKALFSRSDVERLGKEISTMLSFQHENVMSLIGVCLDTDIPLLIMPFMDNGTLLEYVKNHKNVLFIHDATIPECKKARTKLLSMCYQVSKGMEYLAEKRFVHRDLAARNCMIGPRWEIKVADFGLTENLCGTNYFRRQRGIVSEEKVPIRWMAPESIENDIYTEASDVWSFGVTVWEVFTCGRIPYPGIPAMNIRKILQAGDRLERPNNKTCTEEIYHIMLKSWDFNANSRPTFKYLVNKLSVITEKEACYIDLTKGISFYHAVSTKYKKEETESKQETWD